MNRFLIASATAVALLAPAAAFDNTACKAFLTGTWSAKAQRAQQGQKISITARSTYSADGTFFQDRQSEIDGVGQPSMSIVGRWDAGPGAQPDQCAASVTPNGAQPISVMLTVLDDNTVKSPQGDVSIRQR